MTEFGDLRVVWLEAFVRVVDTRKRTAAAEEMGINQATVTKHVQKLEQWLGGQLLLDDNVPVGLLPDGEKFLPVARDIIDRLADARRPATQSIAPDVPRVSGKDIRVPPRSPPSRDA